MALCAHSSLYSNWLKESTNVGHACGRSQFSDCGTFPSLFRGDLLVTQNTQSPEVVNVTLSPSLPHGPNVVHMPELRKISKYMY